LHEFAVTHILESVGDATKPVLHVQVLLFELNDEVDALHVLLH